MKQDCPAWKEENGSQPNGDQLIAVEMVTDVPPYHGAAQT